MLVTIHDYLLPYSTSFYLSAVPTTRGVAGSRLPGLARKDNSPRPQDEIGGTSHQNFLRRADRGSRQLQRSVRGLLVVRIADSPGSLPGIEPPQPRHPIPQGFLRRPENYQRT